MAVTTMVMHDMSTPPPPLPSFPPSLSSPPSRCSVDGGVFGLILQHRPKRTYRVPRGFFLHNLYTTVSTWYTSARVILHVLGVAYYCGAHVLFCTWYLFLSGNLHHLDMHRDPFWINKMVTKVMEMCDHVHRTNGACSAMGRVSFSFSFLSNG